MPNAPKGLATCPDCKGVFPVALMRRHRRCPDCVPRYLERTAASRSAYRKTYYAARKTAALAARQARGLLTLREAAADLGIAYGTILTQVEKQAVTVVREGRRVYLHRDEVERYRREQRGRHGKRRLRRGAEKSASAQAAAPAMGKSSVDIT
jgi:excisionase family DNA binding protein